MLDGLHNYRDLVLTDDDAQKIKKYCEEYPGPQAFVALLVLRERNRPVYDDLSPRVRSSILCRALRHETMIGDFGHLPTTPETDAQSAPCSGREEQRRHRREGLRRPCVARSPSSATPAELRPAKCWRRSAAVSPWHGHLAHVPRSAANGLKAGLRATLKRVLLADIGGTPMPLRYFTGYLICFLLLGLDPSAIGKYGRTAIEEAELLGRRENAELMRKAESTRSN